jgi:hypothetical protein
LEVVPVAGSDKLARLTDKALDTIDEILDLKTQDFDPEERVRVISAKKDAAVSLLNIGLKADENRFKQRQSDILSKLLAAVRADQKMIDVTPSGSVA